MVWTLLSPLLLKPPPSLPPPLLGSAFWVVEVDSVAAAALDLGTTIRVDWSDANGNTMANVSFADVAADKALDVAPGRYDDVKLVLSDVTCRQLSLCARNDTDGTVRSVQSRLNG